MECWVIEKWRGGVGFDFNNEVMEIVCRRVKLDQTRKKQSETGSNKKKTRLKVNGLHGFNQ